MTFHLIFHLLFISLLFIQINGINYCDNGRACPNDYKCSYDGEYCCQNGSKQYNPETCHKRSKWTYLERNCPNKKCYYNEVCDKERNCINKDITSCEYYFDIQNVTVCDHDKLLIDHGFQMCSDYYRNWNQHQTQHNNVMRCADGFFKSKVGSNIPCRMSKHEAINTIMKFYVDCGMCSVPSTLKTIYGWTDKWGIVGPSIVDGFASKCSEKFKEMEKEKGRTKEFVQENVQLFIQKTIEYTKFNTSDFFKDFLVTKENSSILSIKQASTSKKPIFLLIILIPILSVITIILLISFKKPILRLFKKSKKPKLTSNSFPLHDLRQSAQLKSNFFAIPSTSSERGSGLGNSNISSNNLKSPNSSDSLSQTKKTVSFDPRISLDEEFDGTNLESNLETMSSLSTDYSSERDTNNMSFSHFSKPLLSSIRDLELKAKIEGRKIV